MPFMPWSEELVTGLPQIDEQHHWLVDQTNTLYEALSHDTPDREKIHELLEGLVDYTFNHFILEEEIFYRYNYKEEEAHVEEHNQFSEKASSLLERHEAGGDVTHEALEFLKEWLIHHILVVDMAYIPFIKQQMSEEKQKRLNN